MKLILVLCLFSAPVFSAPKLVKIIKCETETECFFKLQEMDEIETDEKEYKYFAEYTKDGMKVYKEKK